MNITLATLHLFTEQQVFEKVATHLLTQNAKSLGEGQLEECKYRGDGGKMCAAGCLIAEDEYNFGMEGENWNSDSFPDVHRGLIRELQLVHDTYDMEFWRDDLETVARGYKLDITFMNGIK